MVKRSVLITGAEGFIGRNLAARLARRDDFTVHLCGRETTDHDLAKMVAGVDVVFHIAGVNRPDNVEEFEAGNVGFTRTLVDHLRKARRTPVVVFSSSIQATQVNPYGRSKRAAEQVLCRFADETGTQLSIFRLTNVFGKWSRPNYNSVVATFCHNIARDIPIRVSDPERELDLVYVDDVIEAFLRAADGRASVGADYVVQDPIPSSRVTLGDLAERIRFHRDVQRTLMVPDLSQPFNRRLYATYLSHVGPAGWQYRLNRRSDDRGDLAELIKSAWFGQMFVSRTRPGITRGNHYHHTKVEKFFVLAGSGLVRLRHLEGEEVIELSVHGDDYRVVDIPPGYTHSITNVGDDDLVTLFWASEVFVPERPDTIYAPVDPSESEPE
jgi:UDP-2-acetamido-2,6-beta-L-arabino-hexul-4-ose reductase